MLEQNSFLKAHALVMKTVVYQEISEHLWFASKLL